MSSADNDHFFVVKPFPGATATDMNDYIKPLVRKTPHKVILHVGTNDLKALSPTAVADSIINLVNQIKKDSPCTSVGVSALLVRADNRILNTKVVKVNDILKSYCIGNEIPFMGNANINISHLNSKGLHLNKLGNMTLQRNMREFVCNIH